MKTMRVYCAILSLCGLALADAQDQATLQEILKDRDVGSFWHYDDLETGLKIAQESGKPLLVTIRCVPCEACRGMDSQVVNPTDPVLKRLMGEFVPVRIVQAWGLDLSLFQFDMNTSWAAFFLNGDRVIYGRYGTRAAQRDDKAITVPGFTKALQGALELHAAYKRDSASMKVRLAGKTGPRPLWARPADISVIQKTVRWDKKLGRLTAAQQTSCVHCHFVPAAGMMDLLGKGKTVSDRLLWAYPLPETIGLILDPDEKATVTEVVAGSASARAGMVRGDVIVAMKNQPMLSIADVQWVLHQAEDEDRIACEILRASETKSIKLSLPAGWRRHGDFVDRASSWDLFKVKILGVAEMEPLTPEERRTIGLDGQGTALRLAKFTPSWGGMNQDARRSGLKVGDVIIEVDGDRSLQNHSELLAYVVQKKKPGEDLVLGVMREGARKKITVPLHWAGRIDALRKP